MLLNQGETSRHPLNTYPQDIWAEDGWMLAYRDFGTQASAPPMPFFALYNKYRGTLRVMFYNAPNVSYSYYRCELSFVSSTAAGGLLTFTDDWKVSLKDYDPEKRESFMGLTTQFRGWAYADFVVFGYDSNVHADARFRLQIFGVDQSNITLESTAFQLMQLTSSANPSASHSKSDDILDAFNRGQKWYRLVSDAKAALQEKVNTTQGNPWWKRPAAELASSPLASYAPWIAGIVGFVSSFIGGQSTAAPGEPLNFKGSLRMGGQFIQTRPIFAVDLALFQGSPQANFYRPVQGIPWGVFNLIHPPVFRVIEHIDESDSDYGENIRTYFKESWVIDPLQYVFNPSLGMQLISVKAAFTYEDQAPSPFAEASSLSGEYWSACRQVGPQQQWQCEQSGKYPNRLALEIKLQISGPVRVSDRELVVYKACPFSVIQAWQG